MKPWCRSTRVPKCPLRMRIWMHEHFFSVFTLWKIPFLPERKPKLVFGYIWIWSWTSLCLRLQPVPHPHRPGNALPSTLSGRPVCVLHSCVQFLPGERDSGCGDRPERPCGSGVVPEPESQGNPLPTFTYLCLASISPQQQVDPGLAVSLSKLSYWAE